MRLLVIAGLGLVGACDDPGAPFIDISPKVEITYQEGELAFEASLQDPTFPYEIDDPKVRVSVRFRGEEIGLAKFLIEEPYVATRMIDSPLSVDEEVVVIFDRDDGEHAELSATAPPPFTVTPPTDPHGLLPITVTWSPTAKDMMGWRGGCFDELDNGPIPTDTGSLTFPVGVITNGGCDVRLIFSRSRMSLPDSVFASASINITQSFPVAFRVAQ